MRRVVESCMRRPPLPLESQIGCVPPPPVWPQVPATATLHEMDKLWVDMAGALEREILQAHDEWATYWTPEWAVADRRSGHWSGWL